jgi:hypothetical protein
MPITIFVSHSSRDRDLVRLFVRALEESLVLPDKAIRCSSLPGYRLRAGGQSSDILRAEIAEAKVIIGILTPDSLESGWVMFELGAGWGTKKNVVPVIAGVEYDDLPGPLKEINATDAADRGELEQMLEEISHASGIPERGRGRNSETLDELVEEAESYFEDEEEEDEEDKDDDEEAE